MNVAGVSEVPLLPVGKLGAGSAGTSSLASTQSHGLAAFLSLLDDFIGQVAPPSRPFGQLGPSLPASTARATNKAKDESVKSGQKNTSDGNERESKPRLEFVQAAPEPALIVTHPSVIHPVTMPGQHSNGAVQVPLQSAGSSVTQRLGTTASVPTEPVAKANIAFGLRLTSADAETTGPQPSVSKTPAQPVPDLKLAAPINVAIHRDAAAPQPNSGAAVDGCRQVQAQRSAMIVDGVAPAPDPAQAPFSASTTVVAASVSRPDPGRSPSPRTPESAEYFDSSEHVASRTSVSHQSDFKMISAAPKAGRDSHEIPNPGLVMVPRAEISSASAAQQGIARQTIIAGETASRTFEASVAPGSDSIQPEATIARHNADVEPAHGPQRTAASEDMVSSASSQISLKSGRAGQREALPAHPLTSERDAAPGTSKDQRPEQESANHHSALQGSQTENGQRRAVPPVSSTGGQPGFGVSDLRAQPAPGIRTPSEKTGGNPDPGIKTAIETETIAAPQAQPARQISLKLSGPDSARVDVQLSEKGGKVQVAVRTADHELAKSLQGDLGDLVGRLENKGFKTEVWVPGASHPSHIAAPDQSSSGQGNPEHSGFGAGQEPRGQGRNGSNQRQQARWMAQLEETLSTEETRLEQE